MSQTRWYVDVDAIGAGTGLNWEDAYSDLQDALAVCAYGDEIWVAEGTYYPTSGTDEEVSFVLPVGIKLYGGFSGEEEFLEERDLDAHPTVLSGDIGLPDFMEDNSKTIMYIENPDSNNLLNGLVFRDGYADGESGSSVFSDVAGGAIFCYRSDTSEVFKLDLRHCSFENNWANNRGGALLVKGDYYEVPMDVFIQDCFFEGNGVDTIGDSEEIYKRDAGAVSIFPPAKDVIIQRTSFIDNFAYGYGAALAFAPYYNNANDSTIVLIDSCEFQGNESLNEGPGSLGTINGPGSIYVEAALKGMLNFYFTNNMVRYNDAPYCSGLSFFFYDDNANDSCKVLIEGNVFEGNENHSLRFDNSGLPNTGRDLEVVIRNNFFSNTSTDIDLYLFEASIYGNVFEKYSFGEGILRMRDLEGYYDEPIGDSSLIRFYNNTCYGDWNYLFYLQGVPNDYSYLDLYNNIFFSATEEPWATLATFETSYGYDNLFNMRISNCLMSFPDSTFLVDELSDYGEIKVGAGMQYGVVDAGLWDPQEGDYRLQPCSPAVNAGQNDFWLDSTYMQDFAGAYRIQDGVIDIGAYEADSIYFELLLSSDASCASASDGGALFSAENYCGEGIPAYTLSWPGGSLQNSFSVDGLSPGNYTFTFTDAKGREAEVEVEINWEEEMWQLETSVVPTMPGLNQGQVLILGVEGGQPPYTYLWDDGDTSAFHTGLSAGWHEVTITDAWGCSFQASWEVTVYTAVNVLSGTDIHVRQWPNPLSLSSNPLHFDFSAPLPVDLYCRLYNSSGLALVKVPLTSGSLSYKLPLPQDLSPGLYFWMLEDSAGRRLLYGKVVVQ